MADSDIKILQKVNGSIYRPIFGRVAEELPDDASDKEISYRVKILALKMIALNLVSFRFLLRPRTPGSTPTSTGGGGSGRSTPSAVASSLVSRMSDLSLLKRDGGQQADKGGEKGRDKNRDSITSRFVCVCVCAC